jgi:hypothetical protein
MTTNDQMAAAIACEKLSVAFANHIDARRYDELIALFADDGVFERGGKPVKGHAAIRAEMDRRPLDMVTMHVCTNILIDVTGPDRATGVTYYLAIVHNKATGPGPHPLSGIETAGMFQDVFTRTPAGWRIAERKAVGVFRRQAP